MQNRAGLSRLGLKQSNAESCRPVKTGPEAEHVRIVQACQDWA